MDSKSNKYAQYLPFANHSGELCSNTPGDFINSEDLKQHLPRAMEMINQADGPGMNPLPGQIPSPQNSTFLAMPQSMNMQNKIPGEITTGSNIGARVGTANRWYHWLYVNKKIFFSRKKSKLHEAQLNFKLLEGIGIFHFANFARNSSFVRTDCRNYRL